MPPPLDGASSSTGNRITRRRFIATASALAAAGPAWAQATSQTNPASLAPSALRVATLDWALFETLLAIGANVVAATELVQFRDVAVTPPVPETVADLGLRGTPNLETLRLARPDLIVNSNFYAAMNDRLSLIAPVESHAVYRTGEGPYGHAETMTRALGDRLGLAAGAALVAATADRLDRLRGELRAQHDGRPVIAINFGDARHFRVFGADNIFGEVLARLGIANAWDQPTSYSAAAPVGIEALAGMPDAFIVIIPPTPADVAAMLSSSAFWQALPAVKAGRVIEISPVNPYGALPAARRFADLLAEGLAHAQRRG